MVKPETITLRSPKGIRTVVHRAGGIESEKLERMANGAWFVSCKVFLRYRLADGRTVTVEKNLRLRGAQEGKKPNPNPFGRNKRKK
jgi:hypothetical protein